MKRLSLLENSNAFAHSFVTRSWARFSLEHYGNRGVPLKDIEHLLMCEAKRMLPSIQDDELRLRAKIESVAPVAIDDYEYQIVTMENEYHGIHRYDRVLLKQIDVEPRLTRSGSGISAKHRRKPAEYEVVQVMDARSLKVVEAPDHSASSTMPRLSRMRSLTRFSSVMDARSSTPSISRGAEFVACLNMHKLVPEVVIPLTIVEERIVRISDLGDAQTLLGVLSGESNLRLQESITLPSSGTRLRGGLTLHGVLSTEGHIRRKYWSLGNQRAIFWKTSRRHGREQHDADPIPLGVAEEQRFATREDILCKAKQGEFYLVFRKGVSYAEVCHHGMPLSEFISHNWAEASHDFLNTLQMAQVNVPWVCSLALDQHCVPSFTGDFTNLPFYEALKVLHDQKAGGRVVMALDTKATVLTRSWCVFECWVSRHLRLPFHMFLPTGELNFWSLGPEADAVSKKIMEMDLEKAECTNEQDKAMILKVIEEHGAMQTVNWQAKKVICRSALVFLCCTVSDISAMLFSIPFIYGCVYEWTETALPHTWQVVLATCVSLAACAFHLRRPLWLIFGQPGTLCTTWNTIKLALFARTMARKWTMVLLFDILSVIAIVVLIPWGSVQKSGIEKHLLCGVPNIALCISLSVYLIAKTLPWAVFLVAFWSGRAQSYKNFEMAAPTVGFLLALSSVCALKWRQYLSADEGSLFCKLDSERISLYSVTPPDDFLLFLLLTGLQAWLSSASWGIAWNTFSYMLSKENSSRICLATLSLVSIPVILVCIFLKTSPSGVVLFGIAKVCWHRHFLYTFALGMYLSNHQALDVETASGSPTDGVQSFQAELSQRGRSLLSNDSFDIGNGFNNSSI